MSDIEEEEIRSTSVWLEDSDNKKEKENIPQTPKYLLQNVWCLYDHTKSDSNNYESSMRSIGEFNDVIDFWRIFNFYPRPSVLFNNGMCKPTMGNKEISSISLFKKGIEPKWEDPINKYGGEISKRKFDKKDSLNELDNNWYILLMACIGEQIDSSITGIRIVDSSGPYQNKNDRKNYYDYNTIYRIELWFDQEGLLRRDIIEESFKNLLSLDGKLIYFKEHKPRS